MTRCLQLSSEFPAGCEPIFSLEQRRDLVLKDWGPQVSPSTHDQEVVTADLVTGHLWESEKLFPLLLPLVPVP